MPLLAIRWTSRSQLSRPPQVRGPAGRRPRLSASALHRAPLLDAPQRHKKGSDKQDGEKSRGRHAAGSRYPIRFPRRSTSSSGEHRGRHAQDKGEGPCRSFAAAISDRRARRRQAKQPTAVDELHGIGATKAHIGFALIPSDLLFSARCQVSGNGSGKSAFHV
jgi:hypothetical protein